MTSTTTNNLPAPNQSNATTAIALCFAVAVLEGFDIQAIGIAAPKLGAELGLDKALLGQALSASNVGLVLGASLGGWLADKLGRKPVLIASVVMFGLFTLLTMFANAISIGGISISAYSVLFAVRLGCGLGFGAALPNIMAMSTEVAPVAKRGATATMMFCGMPVGGGTVALISWLNPEQDWRMLFLIGGVLPFVLTPILIFMLRETQTQPIKSSFLSLPWWQWALFIPLYAVSYWLVEQAALLPGAASITGMAPWLALMLASVFAYAMIHRQPLFGEGRAAASILLWVIFLPTLLILYMILNWLPTLVVAKGFTRDAAQASVWFNWASVFGALFLGRVVDRFGIRWSLATAYALLIASLLALSQATTLPLILALSGAVGFFLLGANYALYGAAAAYYPQAMRGRGSGASVAWGRLGAVAGPLAGGYLLAGGASSDAVMRTMIPFAILAGVALLALSFVGKTFDD
jgi:AAHS family 3-hydroxyphenylpropionic acid transporter